MEHATKSNAENILFRQIRQNGRDIDFYAPVLNEYNETVGYSEYPLTVRGIFHESRANVSQETPDGAIVRTVWKPSILTLPRFVPDELAVGFYTEIGDSGYQVLQLKNLVQAAYPYFAFEIILQEVSNSERFSV